MNSKAGVLMRFDCNQYEERPFRVSQARIEERGEGMIAKDGQPAESDSQSNYEAAVLDFLDNEMVDVQSTLTEKKQSEELDALVANLLHQVMTESEQAQTGEMMVSSEDMNDLLAEFTPQPDTVSLPESENTSPDPAVVQTESLSSEPEDAPSQEAVESPVPESLIAQTPEIEAPTPIAADQYSQPRRHRKAGCP